MAVLENEVSDIKCQCKKTCSTNRCICKKKWKKLRYKLSSRPDQDCNNPQM